MQLILSMQKVVLRRTRILYNIYVFSLVFSRLNVIVVTCVFLIKYIFVHIVDIVISLMVFYR